MPSEAKILMSVLLATVPSIFPSRALLPLPTDCSANVTAACQCGHHHQLLVPNVQGTNICDMAPSLLADEVAGANSADSFCSQVPHMFCDIDFVLKLLLL